MPKGRNLRLIAIGESGIPKGLRALPGIVRQRTSARCIRMEEPARRPGAEPGFRRPNLSAGRELSSFREGCKVNEKPLSYFEKAIQATHGAESELVRRERVVERFQDETVWEGEVLVFKLYGLPRRSGATPGR